MEEHDWPVVYCVVHEGIVSFVGGGSKDVSGHAPYHFEGKHVLTLVHPDDLGRVSRLLDAAFTGTFDTTFRILDSDGTWTWRRAEGVRTIDADGQPQAVFGVRRTLQQEELSDDRG